MRGVFLIIALFLAAHRWFADHEELKIGLFVQEQTAKKRPIFCKELIKHEGLCRDTASLWRLANEFIAGNQTPKKGAVPPR